MITTAGKRYNKFQYLVIPVQLRNKQPVVAFFFVHKRAWVTPTQLVWSIPDTELFIVDAAFLWILRGFHNNILQWQTKAQTTVPPDDHLKCPRVFYFKTNSKMLDPEQWKKGYGIQNFMPFTRTVIYHWPDKNWDKNQVRKVAFTLYTWGARTYFLYDTMVLHMRSAIILHKLIDE